nr:7548_t:CDS:2 [Entrophospora candida]
MASNDDNIAIAIWYFNDNENFYDIDDNGNINNIIENNIHGDNDIDNNGNINDIE